MPRKDDYVPCIKGCGKLVNNASSICMNCRTKDCRRCRKPFKAPSVEIRVCEPCQTQLKRNERRMGAG